MSKILFSKKLGVVLAFLLCMVNANATDATLIESFNINGASLVVGNTNTELVEMPGDCDLMAEDTQLNSEGVQYEKGKMKNLNPDPANNLFNQNCAQICVFYVDEPEECEKNKPEIKLARLSWGGRVKPGTTPDNHTQVKFKIGDLPYQTVSASSESNMPMADGLNYGLYSCHADVTNIVSAYFNDVSKYNRPIDVCVANLQTELERFGVEGLFSGWTLTLVYSHNLLPKRYIMVYDCDMFGPSNTNGANPDLIQAEFPFGSNVPAYSGKDSITFIYSGYSGFYGQDADRLLRNPDLDITKGNFNKKATTNTITLENGDVMNPFRSSIHYIYNTRTCNLSNTQLVCSSRGFDLHAIRDFPIDPNNPVIKTGASSFNIVFTPANEYHWLANAVVQIGSPDVPQTNLQVENLGEVKVTPSEEIKMPNFTFTVGRNEPLTGIGLKYPVSEYVDTFTSIGLDFKLTPADLNVDQNRFNAMYAKFTIDGGTTESIFFSQLNDSTAWKKIRNAINTRLKTLNKANQVNAFKAPSDVATASFTIEFFDPNYRNSAPNKSLQIPSTVKNKEVFVLQSSIRIKPADDWVFKKSIKIGRVGKVVPQAELTVTGGESGNKSALESTTEGRNTQEDWDKYMCEMEGLALCNGCPDGPGDFPPFPDGDGENCEDYMYTTEKDGVSVKDRANEVTIKVQAQGDCDPMIDTINFYFCEEIDVALSDIYLTLVSKYNVNIDSIAKADSCTWEMAKQDSLKEFLAKHGVNYSHIAALFNNTGQIQSFASTEPDSVMDNFLKCDGVADYNLLSDSIDKIINMTTRFSQIITMFDAADTTHIMTSSKGAKKFDVLDQANWDATYHITGECTKYLYFYSPWKAGEKSCSKPIVINFIKENLKAPTIIYNKDTILPGKDTLYFCKNADIDIIHVGKTHNDYDIYADILYPDGSTKSKIKVDATYNPIPSWNVNDTIDKNKDGIYRLGIYQKNLQNSCKPDTAYLYLVISDFEIAEKPKVDKSVLDYCVSTNEKDSITLVLDSNVPVTEEVRWYELTKDKDGDPSREVRGEGESVKVRQDKDSIFTYAAVYFKDFCESGMDTITITVHALPEKLKAPDIAVCQYVSVDSAYVAKKIVDANSSSYKNMLWFSNMQTSFTENEARPLTSLLSVFNFNECGEKEVIVAPQNEFGCIGDTTLVTINVICFDSTSTSFKNGMDSVLFCVGDNNTSLDTYINQELYPENSKWFWYSDNSNLPVNTTNPLEIGSPLNDAQKTIVPEMAYIKEYYLVRVDSSNCVSNPSKFKVVVGDSIKSVPFIGDTVSNKFYDAQENKVIVKLCKGMSIYKMNALPIKTSVDGYNLEWVPEMDPLTDNCDTLRAKSPNVGYRNSVRQDTIWVKINNPGSSYYCVRQSTQIGCKGPWVNLSILVHDSVRVKPQPEQVVRCQYDSTVHFKYSENVSDPNLRLVYYDAQKGVIDQNDVLIHTNTAGENLPANTYYMSYVNDSTTCEGERVSIQSLIHPKPVVPDVLYDSLYYCATGDTVHLTKATGANAPDKNTKLVWKDTSWVLTDVNRSVPFYVYQEDTLTGCKSDKDTVTISIEKTFNYSHIDIAPVCYGQSVDLWSKVENAITRHNKYIKEANATYTIHLLHGNNPDPNALTETQAQNIVSSLSPTDKSVQRYLVSISEPISNCSLTDTVVITFNPLPKFGTIPTVRECQDVEFRLPTPFFDNTTYSWYNGNSLIGDSIRFSSSASITLSLVGTTDYGCKDSVKVPVTIDVIPEVPDVRDTAFCQNTGDQILSYSLDQSVNGSNKLSDLYFAWVDMNGDTTSSSVVNTNVDITAELKYTFYGVANNSVTGCMNSKQITVSILPKINLSIDDPSPICEPELFDARAYINQYVSLNKKAIGGFEPSVEGYFSLLGNNRTNLLSDEMAQLAYVPNESQVPYGYVMKDSRGVCSSEDTFVVTINHKPSAPLIEDGSDSLFFCRDNAPLYVNAADTALLPHLRMVWQDNTTGPTYQLDENKATVNLNAYLIDTLTSCKSDLSKSIAIVAKPITVKPIGGKDTLMYCAGTVIDLWTMAFNSFVPDLKDRSSFSIVSAKKGNVVFTQSQLGNLVSTVQDTSTYTFEVLDALTNCTASNSVTIIYHALPHFQIEGQREICKNDGISLNVTGDDRDISYAWYYGSSLLSSDKKYEQSNLQADTTITVIGTLMDSSSCKSTVLHHIQVDSLPAMSGDTSIHFCQDTTANAVTINFDRSAKEISDYMIIWMNASGDTLQMVDDLLQDITVDGITEYHTVQVDRVTGCVSPVSKMTVTVSPQIRSRWVDPETICQPYTYNLMEDLSKSIYGGTNPRYQYTTNKGVQIDNETAISEDSDLKVYYKDDKGCELVQPVSVRFYKQPGKPELVGDTIVCQGIGDIALTAKKTGTGTYDQTFEWVSGTLSQQSDELVISTEKDGKKEYILRAIDTLNHCYSEADTFTMDVRKKIEYKPVGLLESCHNVAIDLPSKVEGNYGGSDEEKHYSYYRITAPGVNQPVTDPTNVLTTGRYLVEASETESKCVRTDTVDVKVYDSLMVSTTGTKEICYGAVVPDLKATNATDYTWRRESGMTGKGEEFPFAESVRQTETFRLIGEMKLGNEYCADSIDVTIVVDSLPFVLRDTAIHFCQDTTANAVTINFNRSAKEISDYMIIWMNASGDTLQKVDDLSQDITVDGITEYHTVQVDRVTGCVSPVSKMTVTVSPQIRSRWVDPETICQPYTYNLMEDLSKSIYGGTNPRYQYTTNKGVQIDNETAISEDSDLKVYYKDDKGCELVQPVSVRFYKQPGKPELVGDTIVCQGIGDITLTAKKTGTGTYDQTFEWVSGTLSQQSDELVISTEKDGKKEYILRAIDTLNHCYSEADTFTMDVRKKIEYKPVGLLESCHNVAIDLPSKVEGNYGGSDEEKHYSYYRITAPGVNQPVTDPTNVLTTGRYLVEASETESKCVRTDTIDVKVYDSLMVSTTGTKEICYGAVVPDLKATNATDYTWRRESGMTGKGEDFPFAESVKQTETFRLIGEMKLGTEYCADSIDVTIVVDSLPFVLRDTAIHFCQDTTANAVVINFDRGAKVISDYTIMWLNVSGDTLQTGDDMRHDIKEDGVTEYTAVQIDKVTGCVSPVSKMTVTVSPQIRSRWVDPETICQPYTYNLMEDLSKSIYGGTNPRYQYTTNKGVQIDNETAISEDSDLKVYYKDDKGCELVQPVSVRFYKQPGKPELVGDTIVCQGIGDITLTAKKTGTGTYDQTFEWVSGTLSQQSDELVISTEKDGKKEYILRAIDTLNHCYSEADTFTMDVRKKIEFKPVGLLESCYNVAVDLPLSVEGNYSGSDEEKHFTYYLVTATGSLQKLTDPSHVLTTGKYLVEASEMESKCVRQDTIDVKVYDSLQVSTVGSREICFGDIVPDLKAVNASEYTWRRENGVTGQGESFPFADAVKQTETFRLIGEMKLGTEYCADSIDVKIIVDSLPAMIGDTAVQFCQDTTSSGVKINFNRSAKTISNYTIVWMNASGDTLQKEDDLLQDITVDGVTEYSAVQIDKATGCVSPASKMTVTVNPQIRSRWVDPDTICQPFSYNLMEDLNKSIYGGTNPRYQYTMNGSEKIENETAITENSKLKVYYKDDKGCELVQAVSVQFYKQPSKPELVGDTIVCQGIGDITLTAKKKGTGTYDQTFEWATSTLRQVSDELIVSTEKDGTKEYILRALDTTNHCYSEADTFTMDVRKKIEFKPVGLLESCYNVAVDLPASVEGNFGGSDEEKHYNYYLITASGVNQQVTDPTKVLTTGKYLIEANETESKCMRQDTIEVKVYDSLQVSTTGVKEICYGDVVPDLKAINASEYTWRRENGVIGKGEEFPFADAVKQTETFRLIGEMKMGTLYCQDSIDVLVTVNPNPQIIPDTVIRLCQQKDGEDIQMTLPTLTSSDERLRILWFDAAKKVLFDSTEIAHFSIQTDESTQYYIKQKNTITGCESDYTPVTVKVYPQIEAIIPDSSTCLPNTINLVQLAKYSAKAKTMTALIDADAFTLVSNGNRDVTANASALDESGLYKVNYSYTSDGLTCTADATTQLTFYKQPEVPKVEDQTFCQNTGLHELVGNPTQNNLRLVWENVAESLVDTVTTIVKTDLSGTRYYQVRQVQDITNCVSRDTLLTVTIHPAVKFESFTFDTCAKNPVYFSDVVRKHNISYSIDSLYNVTEGHTERLTSNIGTTGTYTFIAKDENGCKVKDSLYIKMHSPGKITLSKVKPLYCYGEITDFSIKAENDSKFEWYNIADGNVYSGDTYQQPIMDSATYEVIITESVMRCRDTLQFSAYTYKKIDVEVNDVNVCLGTEANLHIQNNNLRKYEWWLNDSMLVSDSVAYSYYPTESDKLTVNVTDVNNCLGSKDVYVNVASIPNFTILALNEDGTLESGKSMDKEHPHMNFSTIPTSEDENLTFYWNFGDGTTEYGAKVIHDYFGETFVYNRPLTVRLNVEHEFGCQKNLETIVTVDSDIKIPNTYYAESGSIFMEDYQLRIFDRVGTLIYEGVGWDGTYKGKPASDDTYFYAVHYYSEGVEQIKTGYVTLIND